MRRCLTVIVVAALAAPAALAGPPTKQKPTPTAPAQQQQIQQGQLPWQQARIPAQYRVFTREGLRKGIKVHAGERFIFALPANPTTGYSWNVKVISGLLVVRLIADQYVARAPGVIGGGGTHYFLFHALRAGRARIGCHYRQPWAGGHGDPPFTVRVRVRR